MTTVTETAKTSAIDATQWEDVYMRKALDDKGVVPFKGSWTNSPDIVPSGPNVIPNHADVLTKSMDKDLGRPVAPERANYYYVRGVNGFKGARDAQVELYYCPQNLFLVPSLWTKQQMKTSRGETKVKMSATAANAAMAGEEPFVNVPAASSVHHCLVARVITSDRPNPLPTDSTVGTAEKLGKFICENPNYAWRNVVMLDPNVPTFTNAFDVQVPGTGLQEVIFALAYRNFSKDSEFEFSSGTPIPDGPDKGKLIVHHKAKNVQTSGSFGTPILKVPGGFKTTVRFSCWLQPPILDHWKAEFVAIAIVDAASEAFGLARPLDEIDELAGISRELLVDVHGNMPRGIKAGSCAAAAAS